MGTAFGVVLHEHLFGPAPPVDIFRGEPKRIEDNCDAAIVLGPPSVLRLAPIAYPPCADPDYIERRNGRMIATGRPSTVRDRLAQEYAAAKPIWSSAIYA